METMSLNNSHHGRKLRRYRGHLRATNYCAKNAPRTDDIRNCGNPGVLRENI